MQCPHCGRTGFKSGKGLQQHIRGSKKCKEKEDAQLSVNINEEKETELARVRDLIEMGGKRVTRSQVKTHLVDDADAMLHHDEDAQQPAFSKERSSFQEADADSTEAGHFDLGARMSNQHDVEDVEESEAQDDDIMDQDVDDDDQFHHNDEYEDADDSPSTRGLDDFVAFCDKNKFFAPLTDAEEAGIKLMDALRLKKAPMNAYAAIMDWHLRERGVLADGTTLRDAGPDHYVGRNALIARLGQRYNLKDRGPTEKIVRLPSSKEVVKIPVFDAEDCIVELLTNPLLQDEDFDFFDDDPLAPPPEDLDYIGNNNTGSAYKDTYNMMITGPNQQLIGVIFYIDGATTGHFADLPVTAVKFSLSCFTREARLKEHMWAILGYLPQVKVAEGRGKKIFQESQHMEAEDIDLFDGEGDQLGDDDVSDDAMTGVKAQNFHYMLSVILKSFVDPIQSRGMLWDLAYKNKVYPKIHFKFFISMVRCDTEEADTLCGKYKSRTRNVKHLCRQCHVPTMEADNHRANYAPKTQKEIEKLIQKGKLEKLKDISQHYIKNAWYGCRFNLGNDRGIHWACPSEMLHAMQLGIFKYTRDIFFDFIGNDAQIAQEINGLARIYGKLISHQSERSLPATNFSKGIKDGKLMAKDYRGVLLIMAAVLVSTEGRRMLSTKRKFKKDHRKDDWILLVELLLEWEAYLCQPTMKKSHVTRLGLKHRYIMYIMRKVAKRSKGMGLNIMKFHTIVHLMEDIQLNGVPLEFDTAANESHHKPTKYAAQLTQRNESTFQLQVAIRLWEFKILAHALHEILTGVRPSDYYVVDSDESMPDEESNSQTSSDKDEIFTDDAMITVYYDEEEQANAFKMASRSRHADKTAMNNELLDFLVGLQGETSQYLPAASLPIYTRHQRGKVIFHAHPNYRGQGPWKDWAIIDWGKGWGRMPGHIHAFVVLDNMPKGRDAIQYGGIALTDGAFAVVEAAELQESELGKSDIFVPYQKMVKGIDSNGQITGQVFFSRGH